jgi:tetratricopeptide (TPR) repeat protein
VGILSLATDVDKPAGRNKASFRIILAFSMCLFFLSGCTQLVIRTAAPSLVPNFTASIFEECDPDLAKNAIPGTLKLMEGLLRSDPRNREILVSLSMGFAGYSLLFVETESPEKASELYLRARAYGLQALGKNGTRLMGPGPTREELNAALKTVSESDYQSLFWMTLSWNAWIALNLDKPEALSQMAAADACLKRLLEMDPLYLYGLPHVLMGVSLSARPPLLGGNPREALAHFEAALRIGGGKFFLTQVFFARYYAVRVQDKDLFDRLLREVTTGNPRELKDVCLINRVMQQRADDLKKKRDDFFI